MWTDDEYPSSRSHSLGELSPIDKIIDSDEFDLGIADLGDSELEVLTLWKACIGGRALPVVCMDSRAGRGSFRRSSRLSPTVVMVVMVSHNAWNGVSPSKATMATTCSPASTSRSASRRTSVARSFTGRIRLSGR